MAEIQACAKLKNAINKGIKNYEDASPLFANICINPFELKNMAIEAVSESDIYLLK